MTSIISTIFYPERSWTAQALEKTQHLNLKGSNRITRVLGSRAMGCVGVASGSLIDAIGEAGAGLFVTANTLYHLVKGTPPTLTGRVSTHGAGGRVVKVGRHTIGTITALILGFIAPVELLLPTMKELGFQVEGSPKLTRRALIGLVGAALAISEVSSTLHSYTWMPVAVSRLIPIWLCLGVIAKLGTDYAPAPILTPVPKPRSKPTPEQVALVGSTVPKNKIPTQKVCEFEQLLAGQIVCIRSGDAYKYVQFVLTCHYDDKLFFYYGKSDEIKCITIDDHPDRTVHFPVEEVYKNTRQHVSGIVIGSARDGTELDDGVGQFDEIEVGNVYFYRQIGQYRAVEIIEKKQINIDGKQQTQVTFSDSGPKLHTSTDYRDFSRLMPDVTLRDFYPFNRWTHKDRHLVDYSTQRPYMNESRGLVGFKCFLLAISTIPVHLIAASKADAKALWRVARCHHLHPVPKSEIPPGTAGGIKQQYHRWQWQRLAKENMKELGRVALSPITLVGLEASAIFGMLPYMPWNGRKLYASFERLQYGDYVLAPCFQPGSKTHLNLVRIGDTVI